MRSGLWPERNPPTWSSAMPSGTNASAPCVKEQPGPGIPHKTPSQPVTRISKPTPQTHQPLGCGKTSPPGCKQSSLSAYHVVACTTLVMIAMIVGLQADNIYLRPQPLNTRRLLPNLTEKHSHSKALARDKQNKAKRLIQTKTYRKQIDTMNNRGRKLPTHIRENMQAWHTLHTISETNEYQQRGM